MIPYSERNHPRGAAHALWTGNAATYGGMHKRVVSALGPASEHHCHECGSPADHWSYDHADPDERQSDRGAYSIDINHYVPRCISCHKKFDMSLKPKKPDAPVDLEVVRRLRDEGNSIKTVAKALGVPRRHIDRAIDALGLPRVVRTGPMPKPRCGQPVRPPHGAVTPCGKPKGHPGSHETLAYLKTGSITPREEAGIA